MPLKIIHSHQQFPTTPSTIPSPPTHPHSNLIEKPPILNLKRLPTPRRELHRIPNQPPLLPQLQIDILLVVFPADMRHVDRDEDVGALFLEPDQVEHYGGEIGRGGGRAWGGGGGEGRRLGCY